MTDTGDAIADIATGAVLARAVEPKPGEGGDDGHSHENACLNCGTALIGSHCHTCGQAAHVHKTLGAFFHDLLHGVFHFEGKIWRTLPMLAWKPGQLTREYIDGRRASYVSPIALFLFVVFLTFALFNAINGPIHIDPQTPNEAAAAVKKADLEIAALEKTKAEAEARGEPLPGIDGQIVEARAGRDAMANYAGSDLSRAAEGINKTERISSFEPLNVAWRKAKQNPDLLIYKLQSSAYKYSWLLIPISVPFVWLLFPFSRRFKVYDHTIFVTYSVSFMLLLISVISLGAMWNAPGLLMVPLVIYAPFHVYRHLRGTYALSRFGAWWRTWFITLFALMALGFFAVALTLLAAGG